LPSGDLDVRKTASPEGYEQKGVPLFLLCERHSILATQRFAGIWPALADLDILLKKPDALRRRTIRGKARGSVVKKFVSRVVGVRGTHISCDRGTDKGIFRWTILSANDQVDTSLLFLLACLRIVEVESTKVLLKMPLKAPNPPQGKVRVPAKGAPPGMGVMMVPGAVVRLGKSRASQSAGHEGACSPEQLALLVSVPTHVSAVAVG
jgi:hypothetical protein